MAVGGDEVARIGEGVVALVGIGKEDTEAEITWATAALLGAKLWPNTDTKPWREGVKGREVLLVSNFTLMGKLNKKRVCSWVNGISRSPLSITTSHSPGP